MNCTCIKDMEGKLRDFLHPKIKGHIERVECGCIGFGLTDDGMEIRLLIPFNIKADAPGYRSLKGKQMSVSASFCPFCGKSTKATDTTKQETGENNHE